MGNGCYSLFWTGVGDTRYRIEYTEGLGREFVPVVRSLMAERCDESVGEPTMMSFTDDFTLTPLLTNALRLYRLRVINE